MNLSERVHTLIELGEILQNLDSDNVLKVIDRAIQENPWFTEQSVLSSIIAIREAYLSKVQIERWVKKYHIDDSIRKKKVGLILAGNIPLVGFHDVLSCYVCGHISLIKYSDKDKVLMAWLLEKLVHFDKKAAEYFVKIDRLKEYDAAIATGSNTSAVEFEYYFREVPHIIRRNRNSIALLDGSESVEDLQNLGKDIFTYFGLGCRNVSQIYIPYDFDVKKLFTHFDSFGSIIFHNKYKNNYDYNLAVMLLNSEPFLHNEFLILKESDQIVSRISCLHYQYYQDLQGVEAVINEKKDQIQCVVTNIPLSNIETVKLGKAQMPSLDDYADGVDTLQFLLSI